MPAEQRRMLEVEAKVALDSPDALRTRLHGLGAAATPDAIEEDTFFLHPGRDLAAADEALRLRRLPAAAGDDGAVRFELTYKGPRRGGSYKAREEVNVRLGDDPTALLTALGFRPGVRLRKARQRFRLGSLEVTIDQVDGLGWFAEVEATGPDERAAEAAVHAALRELGLARHPRVERSYLELALAAGASAATRL